MKDYTIQLKRYWKTNDLSFVATLKKSEDNKFGFFIDFINPISNLKLLYPTFDDIQIENKRVSMYFKQVEDLLDGACYKVELEFNSKALAKNNPYLLQIKSVAKIDEEKVKQKLVHKSNIQSVNEKYDIIDCKEHIRQRLERRTKDPDSNKIIANLMREIGKGMYSSKQRVIFELLQNADDAPGKEHVEFHVDFKDNYMFVMHDGEVFSQEDISAITSAAESTKRHDKKKTGYKGIGFKSVFTDSEEVWVKSGGYQFAFLRKSELFDDFESFYFSSSDYKEYPALIQKRREEFRNDIKTYNSATDIPWQLIPIWQESLPAEFLESNFNNFNNPVQFAMKVGEKNIKSPDGYMNAIDNILNKPQFILFLRNTSKFRSPKNRTTVLKSGDHNHIKIEKITIEYKLEKKEQNLSEYHYYKETFSDIEVSTSAFTEYDIEIKKVKKKNDLNEDVYFFTDKEGNELETIPPKLAASEYTEISFGISIFNNKIAAEQNYTKSSPHFSSIFTYLPMEDTRFQLPFLVNADFVPSSDRQKIQGDNLWNRYIMIKVAEKHVEALFLFAEKFITEAEKHSNYLSLLLKKPLPDDDTAQQIINCYNDKYLSQLMLKPIVVNDFAEKQLLSETILDDSGFTDLFNHDLFYKIINTNKRLPHSELNEDYLKKYDYLDVEMIDLKSLATKITPKTCQLIGEEIANDQLYENKDLLKWLDKLVLHLPNLFGKIPFIVHQNKLFSLDTLIKEEEAWVLNSNTIEYKNLFESLGYHTIDLELDTYNAINGYLLTVAGYMNDKNLAYERISRNSILSSLDSTTKVNLIAFFKNSKFMQGIGETKYFGELKLFNDENGITRPLKQLISRKDELEIDSIHLYRIDQDEYEVIPEFIKNQLIKKDRVFFEFILNPELFKNWTTLFGLKTISNYVTDLKKIYSWHPEETEILQSQWAAIPWVYENINCKFIESNHVFWSSAFSKMESETYETIKFILEDVALKVLPNKLCGELITLFDLKTDSQEIENWDVIKQIDTNKANTLLDWMESDGNYSDFLENYTFESRNELWDIIELQSYGVFDGSETELSQYIEITGSLNYKFNKLSSDLCSDKRDKIGLLQGDKFLNAIIATKLFDQNLAKHLPAKSEWKLIESFMTNLSVFKLQTDVEYDSNSAEHSLVNQILEHVEKTDSIPEEIQDLIDQFRSKISINEQQLSDFDLSDMIQFGKVEDKKTLKLSKVLPEFENRSDILDTIIESFVAINNKSKLRKLIFKTRKMDYEEIANRIEENELTYYTVHQVIFQHLIDLYVGPTTWKKEEEFDSYLFDKESFNELVDSYILFMNLIYELQLDKIDFTFHRIQEEGYMNIHNCVENDYATESEKLSPWLNNWIQVDSKNRLDFLTKQGFNGSASSIVKLRKSALAESYNENEITRYFEESKSNTILLGNTIKWLSDKSSKIVTKNIKLIQLINNAVKINLNYQGKVDAPIINDVTKNEIRCFSIVSLEKSQEVLVLKSKQEYSFKIFDKLRHEFSTNVFVDESCGNLLNFFTNKREIELDETIDLDNLYENITLWDERFYVKWEYYEDYPIFIYDGHEIPYIRTFNEIKINSFTFDMKIEDGGEFYVSKILKNDILNNLPETFPKEKLQHLKDWHYRTLQDATLLDEDTFEYKENIDRLIQDRLGISFEEQKKENGNAKTHAVYFLDSIGFDVSKVENNGASLININDSENKTIECIVRSAKGGLLYLDKEHWDMLKKQNTYLVVIYPGNSPRLFKDREELLSEELAKNILFRFKNTKNAVDFDGVFDTLKSESNLILVTSEKMKETIFSKLKKNNSFRTEDNSAVADDNFEID